MSTNRDASKDSAGALDMEEVQKRVAAALDQLAHQRDLGLTISPEQVFARIGRLTMENEVLVQKLQELTVRNGELEAKLAEIERSDGARG